MLSQQIRQKKKKEAVRRLSQGSGGTTAGPGQWPQGRKFPDQRRVQRMQPDASSQRPAKKSHISPLHQDAIVSGAVHLNPFKPAAMAAFSFGMAQAVISSEIPQFTHTSTTNTSVSAAPGFGTAFPTSTSEANSVSPVFGTGFGTNTPKTDTTLSSSSPNPPVNLFAPPLPGPQILSSVLATSQATVPIFGSGFHKSKTSLSLVSSAESASASSLFNIDSTRQPSSTSLTFGGFSKLGSSTSSSADVSSSSTFGATSGTHTSGTALTFGAAGPSLEGNSTNSSAVSKPLFPIMPQSVATSGINTSATALTFGTAGMPLEGNSNNSSAVSKPLFPNMSQSASAFTSTKSNKPQSGIFGRTFAMATESQAKENKEKLAEEKIRGLGTANLTALVIKDIPEMYNKNAWLRRFYSRFGEVTKVVCSAARKSATITFKTHEAAEAAKKKGKILRPGLPPVVIFWKQQGRRRTLSTSESEQQRQDVDKPVGKSPEKSRTKSNQTASGDGQILRSVKNSEAVKDIQDYLQTLEPSENAGEKLQVMEGIDKKLRQVFKRSSDISSAKAVIGTCKDMCPEKERYMREYQRRLSVFETIPGTGSIDENPQVDHTRAIKEYDRSAADKEEPLPHELRPVPVLKMTMDYLATNIMDLVEGREGEWFDFVWNRTRGIRKDITQQHLCDPECVDLVEKTARFHIICAHLLCEADMNSFDAKINTENLTKCLQTLKQFYGDLYKDKGVTCPQEAEFRAYDILLNLNEGDILREVMTFRDEVQKSAEVRFAMDVFHALNSNNFVRFFRLLRNANYLSACLLHRYFTQVRSRAVQTLNHSLSISNRSTPFQFKDLVNILAFEDEAEAGEFCTHHGLSVTEGCVNFVRSSFVEPEARFPVKRSWRLIESKRNCSIGEMMYNAPLPPPPQHQPCLSFDDDGRYIADPYDLVSVFCKENIPSSRTSDQSEIGEFGSATSAVPLSQPFKPVTSDRQVSVTAAAPSDTAVGTAKPFVQTVHRPFTQPPQDQPKPTVVYTAEELTHFTKSLFLEVLNEMCTEITKEALDKVHSCLELSSEITDEIHEQTLTEFIRETASSVLTEERNQKRIAEENAASQERVSNAIRGEVTEEFVSLECRRIVEEVVDELMRELREKLLKAAGENVCRSLIDAGVLQELQNIAWDVLEEEKAERDARLQQLAGRVMRSRTARYFKRWVKCYQTSVHLKGLLSAFPPGAPMLSVEEELQHLVGHNTHSIGMASIRTDAHQREVRDALKKRQAEMDHMREEACKPLDVPSLLADSLRSQPFADRLVPSSPMHWKLVISFPEGIEGVELTGSDRGRFISFVIKEKFKRGAYPLPYSIPQGLKKKIDLLSLYRAETRSFPTQSRILKICTKACYGLLTNSEMREAMDSQQFLGACAAMFVIDWQEVQLSRQAAREAHIRLKRVLESKPPEPKLPVAMIVIDNDKTTSDEAHILSALGIQHLRTDGLLSECKLYSVSSLAHLDDLSQTLCSAVTWLGRRLFVLSLPKTDSLVNFIEDGLQKEFTVPVSEDHLIRKQAKLEQQCPEAIIELFNSVLDHLGDVVSSHSLQRLSWPISEFADEEKMGNEVPLVTWNSQENLQRLRSCITALKLPPPPPAAVDGTWESESELCLEYARSLSPNTTALLNRVQWILARAKRVLDEINFLSTSPRLSAAQVPWPLVLDACVNFRLTSLHSNPGLAERDVFYLEEELNAFVQPSLWRQSAKMSKQEAARANTSNRLDLSRPRKTKDTKLHESFIDMEQQLDAIRGTSHVMTTSSPQTTSLVSPSPIVTTISVTPFVETEPSRSTPDSAIQVTSERLKAAVEEAKLESKRFEELLKNFLGDGDSPGGMGQNTWRKRKAQSMCESKKSPKFLEGLDVPDIDVSFGTLEESLSCFNETLKSQRRSDHFTERRLRDCLES